MYIGQKVKTNDAYRKDFGHSFEGEIVGISKTSKTVLVKKPCCQDRVWINVEWLKEKSCSCCGKREEESQSKHNLKIGSRVTIKDRSYAVLVSHFDRRKDIGRVGSKYIVVGFAGYTDLETYSGLKVVHDIFIKDTETNLVFLHSSEFVSKGGSKVDS